MEKRIVVPDGMLKAAKDAFDRYEPGPQAEEMLAAALRWLSKNPIMPTVSQLEAIWNSQPDSAGNYPYWQKVRETMAEWQRRMFLAPEPEVPEAIKDMQLIHLGNLKSQEELDRLVRATQLEAYRRGQQAE